MHGGEGELHGVGGGWGGRSVPSRPGKAARRRAPGLPFPAAGRGSGDLCEFPFRPRAAAARTARGFSPPPPLARSGGPCIWPRAPEAYQSSRTRAASSPRSRPPSRDPIAAGSLPSFTASPNPSNSRRYPAPPRSRSLPRSLSLAHSLLPLTVALLSLPLVASPLSALCFVLPPPFPSSRWYDPRFHASPTSEAPTKRRETATCLANLSPLSPLSPLSLSTTAAHLLLTSCWAHGGTAHD